MKGTAVASHWHIIQKNISFNCQYFLDKLFVIMKLVGFGVLRAMTMKNVVF
jgi:hypothetical protein